jgi:hypothetical protein
VLCVECASKLQAIISNQAQIADHQFLKAAAMMNQALDDIDYAMPIAPTKGRIPVREIARAMSKETKLTNIHVSHSSGVVLNTGDLAKIDAFVTATGGTEIEPIGKQIAGLTEAIANTKEIADAERRDLIELVRGLSQEIVGERKQSVIKAMLTMIEERAKGAAAVLTLAKGLGISIATLFGP